MPEQLDYPKIYESIWKNIERENCLMNFRNQWAIVLSGGILATEGILLNAIKSQTACAIQTATQTYSVAGIVLLMAILSCMAIYFCDRSRKGIAAALNQLSYLKDFYYSFGAGCDNVFERDHRLPRPFGDPKDHHSGNAAAAVFPSVVLALWSVFALLELIVSVVLFSRAFEITG